jgi:RNA:NAD 2'-phosphotransferase (TPT1/KptA family)/ADP-ribose pyrophosphatase YjhB (NUDIX family)
VGLDLPRLSRTLHTLLQQRTPPPELTPDATGGWPLDVVARVLSASIRRPVTPEDVRRAVESAPQGRFAASEGRLMPRRAEPPPARPRDPRNARPAQRAAPRGAPPPSAGPDILYHATSRERLAHVRERGGLFAGAQGPVHLSRTEAHAWRVAHRQWEDPLVLYVDAARARREGLRVERTRSGHYAAERIPVRHVLNLREGFAEQASAGGFLVDWQGGAPRVALIRVGRRGGATWEVAKGKLEPGETPAAAAAREVREEMGIGCAIRVSAEVGSIRYGFSTPDGSPRLKTIYLYVLEAEGPCEFRPASGEGIDDVRWFALQEALDALAHPSLRSAIGRLVSALGDRAEELGLPRPTERERP